jgi:dipeptidase E
MKLFLASYVSHPDTLKKLELLIGGLQNKKIAYIPTASNAMDGWGKWQTESSTWQFVKESGAHAEPVVLEDYGKETVVRKLEGKDIIWFGGGMTGYLAYWARRCSLDILLPKILNSNVWYVGSSAGAMLAGQTIQVAELKSVDGERGSEDIKPLGLVNFDILPHYEERFLPEVQKKYKKGKLYLLKNGEEIIVENGRVSLIGEERIITK